MTCNCDAFGQDSAAAASGANCHKVPALWRFLTISEAALLFRRHPNTVRYHLDKGRLTYRQTLSGDYLIELDSLLACFGQPARPDWLNFVANSLQFERI